ncbi:MAG: hypothetical protein CO036_03115, partial [Candidatus Omnitrophica bacterium CG_4_9_14_0_2_um_filter_43_12]
TIEFGKNLTAKVVPIYDGKGRLRSYSENKLEANDSTKTSLVLSVRTITTRSGINYDASGFGQMVGYTEEVDRDGQTKTKTVRTLTEYNELGQIKYYKDVITNLE